MKWHGIQEEALRFDFSADAVPIIQSSELLTFAIKREYTFYGNYGPHYVGLTRDVGLGSRLSHHLTDWHSTKWDRFSWFGFRRVLKGTDSKGLCKLADMAEKALHESRAVISDVEALLIRAMGLPNNYNQTRFLSADQWIQIKRHEATHYMGKVLE